jgi:hypothetical protein
MNKTYKFLDTEYTTEKNVLKIENAFIPFDMFHNSIKTMYARNIDTGALMPYMTRFNFYTNKMKIDKSDLENLKKQPELDLATIERVEKAIETNQIELDKINEEYLQDIEAQYQQADLLKADKDAKRTALSSFEVVKTFLDKYLIGDTSKLDYENPLIKDFINEVMEDFFLFTMQNKAELTN